MTWMPLARITQSEAATIAATARSMARTRDSVAIEGLGSGFLVALGDGRYVNRGVGVGPELNEVELDRLEAFYAMAGLPSSLQLGSQTSSETLERLGERGFLAHWFRWVMAAPIDVVEARSDGPAEIVAVDEAVATQWMTVLAIANDAADGRAREVSDEFAGAGRGVEGSINLLALVDGAPVGCGSLEFADGIGWLGGAATIPSHRSRGIQRQLLGHRVGLAKHMGCDLVAATAQPAGGSAHNLNRTGLQLVDVQTVMTKRHR